MSNVSAKPANPAVVGLAGFGMTTLVLQFHNVGWAGNGPVIWLGLIFGGLAQMIAGFQEQKMGNHFGYSAFVSYGAFYSPRIPSTTGIADMFGKVFISWPTARFRSILLRSYWL